jgi:hypothetical protein
MERSDRQRQPWGLEVGDEITFIIGLTRAARSFCRKKVDDRTLPIASTQIDIELPSVFTRSSPTIWPLSLSAR